MRSRGELCEEQGCWLRHPQFTLRLHTLFAPSAWEKLSICRTLLKLGLPWPPVGPANQELRWEDNISSLQRCSAGSCLSQAKVSNGDLWVQPNPHSRSLRDAETCLTIPTAMFLLVQGSWEVSWRAGCELDTLHILPLPSWLTLVLSLFKGNSSQPSAHHFLTKIRFFFPFMSCFFICLEFYLWDSNSSSGGCCISSLHTDCKDFNLVAFILSRF